MAKGSEIYLCVHCTLYSSPCYYRWGVVTVRRVKCVWALRQSEKTSIQPRKLVVINFNQLKNDDVPIHLKFVCTRRSSTVTPAAPTRYPMLKSSYTF